MTARGRSKGHCTTLILPGRSPYALAVPDRLRPGGPAPGFTLEDQSGHEVSLDTFRGRRALMYFYP